MATIALQIAGSVVGQALGGPFGAAIGSAVGATAGSLIDKAWMGSGQRPIAGPRLNDLDGISASEGNAIPRIYGRTRLGGQVIWATEFEEERIVENTGSSGGKTTGSGKQKSIRYAYFANVAIGLCEGPVSFIRRIWADGKPIDLASVTMRFYAGGEDQPSDPLIVAKQESVDVPAFRGLAYVVFERFSLADYGNRLPQFSFEVVRAADGLPQMLRAINIIPGSTEFGYAAGEVREDFGFGNSRALNRTQWTHDTDWQASIDQLQALCPNLERVTLINAWFGSDLRAGFCALQPKVEKSTKATSGADWSVAGLSRASASAVSQTAGRPNFGGSPSDASVIEAIRDLNQRGLAVALHPFILMDIPAGNTLPDPYSVASGQSPFPWRGRITCYPAPGRPGTPENSSAVKDQINLFFGTASPSHFSLLGDVVLYSGPNEWSYRRMVLHQAMLAKAAGGVSTFFLGSELIGLTHLANGVGDYPAAYQLIALAADVRAILGPNVLISYAADWTEYGAHVRNGGQEIRFPLDPLWASPNIGAVGIDFYPPLSDWRDGRAHLDAPIAYSASDSAYLKSRVDAGEAFEWFYANDTDRDAQIRSPITDGALGKPWIYRAKDLKSWWSNPHVERLAGVEISPATDWVARSKPIILAEIGCPAVDKGANQPNVFPDPKSAENALPYFSNGSRDDLVQRRALEAVLEQFDPEIPGHDPADNPISPLYSGRMVTPGFIAPWAWDARPFPEFPALQSLWSDGANWARGHWLNGRLEAVPVERLITMILADHEHETASLSVIDGMIDGYVIDRPMSARAALESVVALFGITARPAPDSAAFMGRPVSPVLFIGRDDLVAEKGRAEIETIRTQETELPQKVSLGFIDGERNFRKAIALAAQEASLSKRENSDESAIVITRGLARKLVDIRLQELWSARETFRFAVRSGLRAIEPGDVVEIETLSGVRQVQITRISDGRSRVCEARAFDSALGEDVLRTEEAITEVDAPALPGAAHVRVLELPIERGADAGPLAVAVRAMPWHGPYSVSRVRAEGMFDLLTAVPGAARVGALVTALSPGPLWRWDPHASMDITLESGALASLGAEAVLAGGNALACLAADSEIEIILFRSAELIGERRYRLGGLLRGIGLSETAAQRTLAAGSECILLDDAVADLGLNFDSIGQTVDILVLPAGRDAGDPTGVRTLAPITGSALRPLAPVHPRARREMGGVRFSFIRRTRKDGDSFDSYEVPLGEEREEYRFEILAGVQVKRTETLMDQAFFYSSASEIADFGAAQSTISIRISQISARTGPGTPLAAFVSIN